MFAAPLNITYICRNPVASLVRSINLNLKIKNTCYSYYQMFQQEMSNILFWSQRLCNIHHMEPWDIRVVSPKRTCCTVTVFSDLVGMLTCDWAMSDGWSSRPSVFQLWYMTFCPPVTHFESTDLREELRGTATAGEEVLSILVGLSVCPLNELSGDVLCISVVYMCSNEVNYTVLQAVYLLNSCQN